MIGTGPRALRSRRPARSGRAGLAAAVLFLGLVPGAFAARPAEDRQYLLQLAKDTWACIDHFRAPLTGFPYDSNLRPTSTNTTNIGLYLASTVAAQRLDFITPAQARQRISPILASLMRVRHWRGFLNNHLDTTGKTEAAAGFNALSDFNILPASLLVVRQAYPDMKLADELFRRIDWSALWDARQNRLMQGFDVSDGKTAHWGHGWLASDVRLAVFLGVAAGGMPPAALDQMEHNTVEQYELSFYRPAWDYAGLFMHGLAGLFLDERTTPLGSSTADFAYAQMLFAQETGAPAWGWSACDRPGQGYTVNGLLSQNVVAPYASALVVEQYPRKVTANLKRLEELGCRPAYTENGKTYAFGFRDSINLTTGQVSELYFTSLDQAMLFLSLANYLKPDCTRGLFMRDPVVREGLAKLPLYGTHEERRTQLYAQRDAQILTTDMSDLAYGQPAELTTDNFLQDPSTSLGTERRLRVERAPATSVRYYLEDTDRGPALKLDFDLRRNAQGNAVLTEPLNGLDGRGYNALAFWCQADSPETVVSFRIRMADGLNSRTLGFVEGLGPQWQEVVLPFESLRGILADLAHLEAIEFRLECAPAEFPDKPLAARQGSILFNQLRLVRLSPEHLRSRVLFYQTYGSLLPDEQGRLTGLTRLEGWQSYRDADADLQLKIANHTLNYLQVTYDLGTKGKWVACEKTFPQRLSGYFEIAFDLKGTGSPATFEVKLFSESGAVFGVNLLKATAYPEWKRIVLKRKDFKYLWGGRTGDRLDQVKTFGLAVSDRPGSKGVVQVRNLVLTTMPGAPDASAP